MQSNDIYLLLSTVLLSDTFVTSNLTHQEGKEQKDKLLLALGNESITYFSEVYPRFKNLHINAKFGVNMVLEAIYSVWRLRELRNVGVFFLNNHTTREMRH